MATLADCIAPFMAALLDVRSVLFTTRSLSACFACGADRCRNFEAIQESAGNQINADQIDHVHQPFLTEGLLCLAIYILVYPALHSKLSSEAVSDKSIR